MIVRTVSEAPGVGLDHVDGVLARLVLEPVVDLGRLIPHLLAMGAAGVVEGLAGEQRAGWICEETAHVAAQMWEGD